MKKVVVFLLLLLILSASFAQRADATYSPLDIDNYPSINTSSNALTNEAFAFLDSNSITLTDSELGEYRGEYWMAVGRILARAFHIATKGGKARYVRMGGGGASKAARDFYSLNPRNVSVTNTPRGTVVHGSFGGGSASIRNFSSGGSPTLQLNFSTPYGPGNLQTIKVRY